MKNHPLQKFLFCPFCGSDHFHQKDEKSKKCTSCGFIFYLNASAATVGLIINDKDELLVATRAKDPAKGTYDIPGGFVDLDETVEEGMRREIKEETNLDISALDYLFSIPNHYLYADFQYFTVDLIFKCTVENFDNIQANDDVASLKFIPIQELDESTFGLNSISTLIKKLKQLYSDNNL